MSQVMVAQLILEVLDEMSKSKQVFSAYDVTVAARAKTDDSIVHNDVRGIIENEFVTSQMEDYNRDLCTLDLSGSPQAQIYYPDGASASDHILVSGSTPISVGISTPVTVPISTSIVDLDDDEYKTKKDGRIQIPRKLTSQVTPNGGTYDVIINGSYRGAKADKRGDVRIGLRRLGITDSKVKVTVDTVKNTIIVETV